MASEDEEVLWVDSPYETIDVIDLTKDSPKIRPLRSTCLRQQNSSTSSTRNSSNKNSIGYIRYPIGFPEVKIKNSTKKKRMCPNPSNTTVTLDDTNEENDISSNLTDKEDDERPSLKCPICFESLSSDLKPTTTRCGHIFCAKCLETLIHSNKKKCPTCQSNITLKSCTRLYI